MDPLEAGRIALSDAVRAYLNGPPHEKTGPMKAAGAAVFQARQHFELADGTKDILGRSPGYRAWLASALAATGLPRQRQSGFLSALRHHVSTEMRARLSPEVLQTHGVAPVDAATRTRLRRRSERLEAGPRSPRRLPPLADPKEIVALLETVTVALGRIHYDTRDADVESALGQLGDVLSRISATRPDNTDEIYF
ncbi:MULTISPECIES: hypothetical protein [Microbacterium]|uniref:hypothetical protein n=1 Tax=Microbacterium TaxID=33882 RepID=UPI000AC2BC55|nr:MULTISPECIES: hypothetical protein [Microbacterium]